MMKKKIMDYNGSHNNSEAQQAQQLQQKHHQEQHNRDFLNFFAEEQQLLQTNDETEAKFVEYLEEESSPKHATTETTVSASSFAGIVQNNRRRHRRDHSVHDKLPFLVHQMSSKKNMISSLREIENGNDIFSKLDQQSRQSSPQNNNIQIGQQQHEKEQDQQAVLVQDYEARNHSPSFATLSRSFSGSSGRQSHQDPPTPSRSSANNYHRRRARARQQSHRRNLSSTQRFFDYLNVAPEIGGRENFMMEDHMNLEQYSQLPIQNVAFSTPEEDDKGDGSTGGEEEDPNEVEDDEEETLDVESPLLSNRSQTRLKRYSMARFYGTIFSVFGVRDIVQNIHRFLWEVALGIIVPSLLISTILFYGFGNPVISFFQPQVSISWCLLFLVRQIVTLHLAKCTNYIVWVLTHRTKLSLRLFGPFVTLLLVQAHGWPFLLTSWGCWDILLLFGRQTFMKNWLFFLHVRMLTNTCSEEDVSNGGHVIVSTSCNPDLGLLEHDFYLRVLFSMIAMGLATALKRTAVALYLGRRMLQHYRPKLEALMYDMELIAEVAELAAETEKDGFDSFLTFELHEIATKKRARQKAKLGFVERVPTFSPAMKTKHPDNDGEDSSQDGDKDKDDNEQKNYEDKEEEDEFITADGTVNYDSIMTSKDRVSFATVHRRTSTDTPSTFHQTSSVYSRGAAGNDKKVHWDQLKNKVKQEHSMCQDDDVDSWAIEQNVTPDDVSSRLKRIRENRQTTMLEHSSWTGVEKTMSQLEAWQEPAETQSKKDLPSIYDILQFQKAYSFIQNDYPFSSLFGPANTRKACVKSSIGVYKRLLKFAPPPPPSSSTTPGSSPKSTMQHSSSTISSFSSSTLSSSGNSNISSSNNYVLPFDVIGALAYNENGELIEKRARALLRVFFPDKDHQLPEIAFVQSIDYVYKRLRFLRASLVNSSKIDSVLEDMFNVLFYMIMLIVMISILGWNPWPLLVSFSTLIVSFAFALGPSAAKYIEGILHIAVRRPYDIGDRVTIEKAESIDPVVGPEIGNTWFVQDITLSTTTLRFATSGEVSTVNNYSICNSRIVNCARSLKPIVTILIKFLLDEATHAKVDLFRSKVEVYLKDRPRAWGTQGIIHLRTNRVSVVDGYVEYKLRAQHVKSWQESAHILVQKGELSRYCAEVAKKLGIAYTNADGPNTQIDVHMKQD